MLIMARRTKMIFKKQTFLLYLLCSAPFSTLQCIQESSEEITKESYNKKFKQYGLLFSASALANFLLYNACNKDIKTYIAVSGFVTGIYCALDNSREHILARDKIHQVPLLFNPLTCVAAAHSAIDCWKHKQHFNEEK